MRRVLEFLFSTTISVHYAFCVSNEIKEAKSYENKDFRDKEISETALLTLQLRSKISCATTCSKERACVSFSFNVLTKLCNLYKIDIPSHSGSTEKGNTYYYMTKDCVIDESSCPGSLGYVLNREVCFCYKVYTTRQNYDSSVKICENDNGELARISNALRQQALENALDGISSYAEAYIQGTRTAGSTTWYYNDGTEVTYFNWNTPGGQPQHRDNGEDYLLVRKTAGYKWHDVYKAEQHIVVCEIE